jgi:hypothetical protein
MVEKFKSRFLRSAGILFLIITLEFLQGFSFPEGNAALRIGDRAVDFSLLSAEGKVVILSSYRNRKNVVLVFYRGYW